MKSKITLLLTIAVIAVVCIGILVFIKTSPKTSTSYEDERGTVYECSKPIPVKDQGVKYMSGAPSLTPINNADADKYCHGVGVE